MHAGRTCLVRWDVGEAPAARQEAARDIGAGTIMVFGVETARNPIPVQGQVTVPQVKGAHGMLFSKVSPVESAGFAGNGIRWNLRVLRGGTSVPMVPSGQPSASGGNEMRVVELDHEDADAIKAAVHELGAVPELDDVTVAEATLLGQELPRTIRQLLLAYRDGGEDILVLRHAATGLALEAGPTPATWDRPDPPSGIDLAFTMLATLVGEPMRISHFQNHRVVHEVLPMPDQATKQVGTSSEVTLELHTEAAFSTLIPDVLTLIGVRNDGQVPTILASTARLDLTDPAFDELFDDTVLAEVDDPHSYTCRAGALYGLRDNPCLNFDSIYHEELSQRPRPAALQLLREQLTRVAEPVVLEAGDLVFFDNRRVVHGRPVFGARYDGSDRWLKRIMLASGYRRLAPYCAGRLVP